MIDQVIREGIREVEERNKPLLSLTKVRSTYYYEKNLPVIPANLLDKIYNSLENSKITLETLAMNDQTNASQDCAFLIGQINSFMIAYAAMMKVAEDKINIGNEKFDEIISNIIHQHAPHIEKEIKLKIKKSFMQKQIFPTFNISFLKEKPNPLLESIDIILNELLKREDKFRMAILEEIAAL
jgi:hypothetical protein